MNQIPMEPISAPQQKRILEQMYRLMERQVQSYYRHRHMGSSTSVTTELAQELLESIEYTVTLVGGVSAHSDLAQALVMGQQILRERVQKAESLLKLVSGTAPRWQSECRWEAQRELRRYLDGYDPLHLAHRGPDGVYYPIPMALPEGIRGIDLCLFYLQVLWTENQIMAAFPEDALEAFWDRLPPDIQNPCEQLVLNGLGKMLIGKGSGALTFDSEERIALAFVMHRAVAEELDRAAERLCDQLQLGENARDYVRAVLPQMRLRMGCLDFPEDLFV